MPDSEHSPGIVQIPANLSAAEARGVVEDLRTRLKADAGSLTVDLINSTDEVSISTVQLLASVSNTASESGIRLGETAKAALDAFGRPSQTGATG